MFDKVIFVSAKESIRLERLMNRNGISKEDAETYNSMEEKIKKAIIIIAVILGSFIVLLLALYLSKYGLSSNKLIKIITPEEIIF